MNVTLIFVIIGCLILGCAVGATVASSYIGCLLSGQNEQTYDVTVTIQAVEHSTRWAEHTNVWVQVYGDQDITYTLKGFHNFTLGNNYHIVFVDRIQSISWGLGYELWGDVISISPVETKGEP
jgi:hypothetical protein